MRKAAVGRWRSNRGCAMIPTWSCSPVAPSLPALMHPAPSPLASGCRPASSPSSGRSSRGHAICWPRAALRRVILPRRASGSSAPWCSARSCLGCRCGSSGRRRAIRAWGISFFLATWAARRHWPRWCWGCPRRQGGPTEMLTSTTELLRAAMAGEYAIGAFNVYNLEGVRAVINAAEAQRSPVMLQLHPGALQHGGQPLVALCLAAAQAATVPVTVHLDHSTAPATIEAALQAGVTSVMADGSHLSYEDNVTFTRTMVTLAHARQAVVEAELGRLTGTEDGLTIAEYEAKFTEPAQAADFDAQTGIDALAVCIGNVHGRYRSEPRLDFDRLATIQRTVSLPLVLHGASGLPEAMVRQSIALGVRKFNVNTEVREAYVEALRSCLQATSAPDVLDLMRQAEMAMQAVVAAKLQLFGSVGKV